jgi:hypothetical protein
MPDQPSTVANLQGLVKMSENPVCQRWNPSRIRELKAYQVASAQGLIKLDAMKNPTFEMKVCGMPGWNGWRVCRSTVTPIPLLRI